MELLLVRHAQPIRIDGGDDQAPADPPLSDVGLAAARAVGGWLATEGIDHLITSPLRRARETAAPLAERLGLEPEVVPGIGEFDSRDASYIPFEEMSRDHEKFGAMVEGRWTDIEGWADPDQFRADVVGALDDVIGRFAGARVAVFTHSGAINVFLGQVLGIERVLWFYPGYASVSRVAASRRGPRSVVSVNETAHLDPARLGGLVVEGPA